MTDQEFTNLVLGAIMLMIAFLCILIHGGS